MKTTFSCRIFRIAHSQIAIDTLEINIYVRFSSCVVCTWVTKTAVHTMKQKKVQFILTELVHSVLLNC